MLADPTVLAIVVCHERESRTELCVSLVIVGYPAGTSLTEEFSLLCSFTSASAITWLVSHDDLTAETIPAAGTDPKLSAKGLKLVFRNVTGDYEGIYYCQAGSGDSMPVGCVFVAGV